LAAAVLLLLLAGYVKLPQEKLEAATEKLG